MNTGYSHNFSYNTWCIRCLTVLMLFLFARDTLAFPVSWMEDETQKCEVMESLSGEELLEDAEGHKKSKQKEFKEFVISEKLSYLTTSEAIGLFGTTSSATPKSRFIDKFTPPPQRPGACLPHFH